MPDLPKMPTGDDRLGVFDAVMWNVEKDPVLRSVIVAMVLLDQEPDIDVLLTRIDAMTRFVPKLRQRVIGNPVSLVPPRWEDDPYFDMQYHLRRVGVKSDGTLRPALRVAEKMAEQDFDRKRPLWEMTLVTGLPKKQSAILCKIHHSVTDGVGGMAMAAALFDLSREPRTDLGSIPDTAESAAASPLGRLLSGAAFEVFGTTERIKGLAGGAASLAKDAVTDPKTTAERGAAFVSSAGRLLAPANEPLSPTMTGRSLSVNFDTFSVPLDDLKKAGKSQGGTLNDAFMAAVGQGLRRYHEKMGGQVDELRVNMPVNLRSKGDTEVGGNRWVPTRFGVPVAEPDPAKHIRQLHPLLKQARTEPALVLSDHVYRLMTRLPSNVATNVAAGMMKGTDYAATNVPGPPIEIFAGGAKVLSMVAFAPKGGASLNVAMMTYAGNAVMGIGIDTVAVSDPALMVTCLKQGFDAVTGLAKDADA